MKQRIAHGKDVETATPSEVAAIVEAALSAKDKQTDYQNHREKGVVQLDATGAGTRTVIVTREFNWKLERVTLGGPGAVNATVALYENDTGSDADLLEVMLPGATGKYSDGFANNLFAPAGTRIIVSVTGGAANSQVTFSFQVKMIPQL